jgi:hypothetical protein
MRAGTPLDTTHFRNIALTDALKNLLINSIGENFAMLPQEHAIRLMTLKIYL